MSPCTSCDSADRKACGCPQECAVCGRSLYLLPETEWPEGRLLCWEHAMAEVERLRGLLNTPLLDDFLEAVRVEQAHQKEKWGVAHDANKKPGDWSLLFHYILGKQARAVYENDRDKYRHHLITLAAICFSAHQCATPTAKEPET